ncbi:MAG: ankyrin repeat domain-containing protein [Rubripirellula sp.]|nr:ankyrin repeat domain-containing protein [Rubripirellula sp.]
MMDANQVLSVFLVVVLSMFGVAGCGDSANLPNGPVETQASTTEPDSLSEEVSPPAPVPAPTKSVYEAAFEGDVDAIKLHIAAGTDLNYQDPVTGSNALISAAIFGQNEAAILLIEGGADLEVRNNEGSTALHSAAFLCREEIVKSLLENGADRNPRNNGGVTALDSVAGPFEEVKPIYALLQQSLGPFGLMLDYEFIGATRPKIAEMLRAQ